MYITEINQIKHIYTLLATLIREIFGFIGLCAKKIILNSSQYLLYKWSKKIKNTDSSKELIRFYEIIRDQILYYILAKQNFFHWHPLYQLQYY